MFSPSMQQLQQAVRIKRRIARLEQQLDNLLQNQAPDQTDRQQSEAVRLKISRAMKARWAARRRLTR
jgi:50S ribosomal subunit-associated GTPase HflX